MKNFFKVIMLVIFTGVFTIGFSTCDNGTTGNSLDSGDDQGHDGPSVIPAEFVGKWIGNTNQIFLTINADGTGSIFFSANPVTFKVDGSQLQITTNTGAVTQITVNFILEGDRMQLGDPSSGPMAADFKNFCYLPLTRASKDSYNVGDTGPGLGIIYYAYPYGFIMEDTQRIAYYLEAAPSDCSGVYKWDTGVFPFTEIGTGDDIGWGRANTNKILASGINSPAANACNNFSSNGKTDWFLPSNGEVNAMHALYSQGKGGFTVEDYYWTSSEYGNADFGMALYVNLDNAYQSNKANTKDIEHTVRPIRAF